MEGRLTKARGVVVMYFSRFGEPLQPHHKVVLDSGAKAIAKIKGYRFGGRYDAAYDYSGPLFFVPDDTLLLDEALCLGIRTPSDLYGGVVPYPIVKTKAITHGLVDGHAERPQGWSAAFADRVREIVLPGIPGRQVPADAIVDFHGDDPEAGPLLRYTMVKPQDQNLSQKMRGRCGGAWQGLPPPVLSDSDSRVIRFQSRTGTSHRSHRGKARIGYSGPDRSPVPDFSKYERPESEDDYRHRMVINAIALVFVSLLSLAGFWLVNVIAHS
jgi:hypothetical protein